MRKSLLLPLLTGLAVLAGCSSDEPETVLSTGWLGTITGYEQVAGNERTGVYIEKATEAAPALTAVYIASAEVTAAPGSNLASINEGDFDEIRRLLHRAVEQAVADTAEIRTQPGPATYSLRIVLSNLSVQHADGQVRPGQRSATRFGFERAAIEAELRDGPSNKKRAVMVVRPDAPQQGARILWPELPERIQALAARFAARLATAKEALSKTPLLKAPRTEDGK